MTRLTVRKIEPVMKAAVPVVKFVEVHTNIECDVSMENMDGVLKSELIGIFTKIDLRYRQLCFLVSCFINLTLFSRMFVVEWPRVVL